MKARKLVKMPIFFTIILDYHYENPHRDDEIDEKLEFASVSISFRHVLTSIRNFLIERLDTQIFLIFLKFYHFSTAYLLSMSLVECFVSSLTH